ncbi:glutamate racemase MurI [Thermoanaerobacter kivui]|uniref:Glutamate racemase n=1 Tax=Thermoanaerobacter kivui TaxID=2325 RepID=A0A097APM7_THEKI|nr:glutamate racemase [Thermoanaerobacter kivui]AIS51773.1 glutamate racemase MurI [Thermoanaerobacter kivui]
MDSRPIGVFDSGVGGLTVLKRLVEVLPGEDYIYFGDTKRVPYGDRSSKEIKKFAEQIINFMKEKKVKAVVIACNTTCATINKEDYDVILFDVLQAGAQSAAVFTVNKKVGVIGTTRTVESKSYEKNIKNIDKNIEVYQVACPDFVPIIEKGLSNSPVAYQAANKYLVSLKDKNIDTLVLGCTHYPLMAEVIEEIMGENVKLVDPAIKLAYDVKDYLIQQNLLNPQEKGSIQFFVSGDKDNFIKTAELILGEKVDNIYVVNIEKY